MRLKELKRGYSSVIRWKNEACKLLTKHYCEKHNQSPYVEINGRLQLTDLAKAHYNESLRLSHSEIFDYLMEMEQDIQLCDRVEKQINEIVNGAQS
jgi:hypothetical protein